MYSGGPNTRSEMRCREQLSSGLGARGLTTRHLPYRTPVPYAHPPVSGYYLYVPKYVPVNTRRYLDYGTARLAGIYIQKT